MSDDYAEARFPLQIPEKLGEGGIGVVYKARDTNLDRVVALKFLFSKIGPDDEERGRFLQGHPTWLPTTPATKRRR